MKRSLRQRLLLIALVGSLLLSACARRYVLEDLGLILTVGYDLADDGKIVQTVTMPQVSEEARKKVLVLSSKGELSKEARENISMATDRQVVSGQLRTAIFSEKLARQGLGGILDTFMRDVNITKSLIICVSDGSAHELLEQHFPARPSSGRYLYELFKKESKNFTVPRATVHDVARDFYEIGTDPVAPYIQTKQESLMAAGTALFRDDQFVGSLSPEETKMMLLLRGSDEEGGDIKQSLSTIPDAAGNPSQAMLTFVQTHREYEVLPPRNGKARIHFTIDIKGQVIEYTGRLPLTEDAAVRKIEQALQKGLTSRMQDLLDQLQHTYRADPLGIGTHLRASGYYQPWSKQKWRSLYENAEIDVDFNLRIVRIGQIK